MDFPPRTREQETGLTAEELALVDQPLFDLVPKKWYDRASEWEEVKALQKKTGACILIYFKDPTNSDQKGMCNWFEGEAGSYNRWRKAMAYFIKFRIQLPGNTETRALAEEFRFKSTPAWFVLRPDGKFPKRLPVFTYPAGNPKPVRQDELMESLTELCTPAYANLF